MQNDFEAILRLTLATSTFVLVLSVWIGGLLIWASRASRKRGRLHRRLGIDYGKPTGERVLHLWREGEQVSTNVPVFLSTRSALQRLEIRFHQAGWKWPIQQILLMVGGVAAIIFTFLWTVIGNPLLAVGVVTSLLILLHIVIAARAEKSRVLFESQFIEALDLAARSLRAGHPLLASFQLIAEEMRPPVSQVFSDICQQQGLGVDLRDSLQAAGAESTSEDMRLFASAVTLQMRSGGNLADLLDRLAAVIRDRRRIQRRVRVLTAQTQMSKRILIALPFVLFVILNLINPDYMGPLYDTRVGHIMLAAGVALLGVGAWVMNRMVKLEY